MPAETDTVTVTYNGLEKVLGYRPHAAVQALLDEAKKDFGVQSNHLLSLFSAAGAELPDNVSAQEAGVKPGDLLILRQSTVKGGNG